MYSYIHLNIHGILHHIPIYICVNKYTYIQVYLYIHIFIYIHMYTWYSPPHPYIYVYTCIKIYMYTYMYIHKYMCIYIYIYIHGIHGFFFSCDKNAGTSQSTGWRRCIGLLKLQVSFRKRATIYRVLLQKMAYENKASYGSSLPCTSCIVACP